MGNCISKSIKPFSCLGRVDTKNDIVLSRGRIRSGLEMGRIYTKAHFIINFSEKMMLVPLQTRVCWRDL